jgi:hypothetical protein
VFDVIFSSWALYRQSLDLKQTKKEVRKIVTLQKARHFLLFPNIDAVPQTRFLEITKMESAVETKSTALYLALFTLHSCGCTENARDKTGKDQDLGTWRNGSTPNWG